MNELNYGNTVLINHLQNKYKIMRMKYEKDGIEIPCQEEAEEIFQALSTLMGRMALFEKNFPEEDFGYAVGAAEKAIRNSEAITFWDTF